MVTEKDRANQTAAERRAAARRDRAAVALRANLRRRKEQRQQRQPGEAEAEPEAPQAPPASPVTGST